MKLATLAFTLLATAWFSSGAFAQDASCDLKFRVHTDSIILVSTGGGRGVVTCRDATGALVAQAAVDIHIDGFGPGIGSFNARGEAHKIAITSPEQIVGTYFVGQGGIGAGEAVGDVMGFKSEQSALAFQADVGSIRGGGLFLNATRWTITLDQ